MEAVHSQGDHCCWQDVGVDLRGQLRRHRGLTRLTQRRVPINARARQALADYLTGRGGPAADEPLFLSRIGTAATPYTIWYTVKRIARLAGVEGVTPHSFRHTVATRLVRDPEVDLVTAATFLGHSRLDTTARYSRPGEQDLEKAAERLG